jgi:hypothetical protein
MLSIKAGQTLALAIERRRYMYLNDWRSNVQDMTQLSSTMSPCEDIGQTDTVADESTGSFKHKETPKADEPGPATKKNKAFKQF